MQLVGVYVQDMTYILQISSNKMYQRWTIYSEYYQSKSEEDDPTDKLNITWLDVAGTDKSSVISTNLEEELLTGVKSRKKAIRRYNLYNYVIASIICNHNGKISKWYGDTVLLASLVDKLVTEKAWQDIRVILNDGAFNENSDTKKFEGYTKLFSDGSRIELYKRNSFIRSVGEFPGLVYQNSQQKNNERQVVTSFGKLRLKTLEQIIKEKHGLTWYFNEDGTSKKDYKIINQWDDFLKVVEILKDPNIKFLAFDTETTGLNIFEFKDAPHLRDEIVGMSLTWKEDQGIYIPFKSEVFAYLDVIKVLDILVPIMQTKILESHNGIFDRRVFKALGYHIVIGIDTLCMAFLLDSQVSKGSKGLKTLTRLFLGHETLELEDVVGSDKAAKFITWVDYDIIRIYGCADTDYVFKLVNIMWDKIMEDFEKPFNLDMRVSGVLSQAEYYGAHIDQDLLATLSDVNSKDLIHLEALMREYIFDMGKKTLATKFLKHIYGDKVEITDQLVQETLDDPSFQDEVRPEFYKTRKKNSEAYQDLEFSSYKDITHILYDILQYPPTRFSEKGNILANVEALEDLMTFKAKVPVKFLKADLRSTINETGLKVSEGERIVISKKEFESYQYPFAYLLSEWRRLNKLQTSFFNPLLSNAMGEYYYTTNSMTAAETARVINPIQTLAGILKKLVIPYTDDYYLVVWDLAQIEFRVMLGLASNYWDALIEEQTDPELKHKLKERSIDYLVKKLSNPEADYHREGGAAFVGCSPENMTKAQRSDVKAVHFSVPYGASAYGVSKAKLRKARTEREREKILNDTSLLLGAWQKNLYPLYFFLERVRDQALVPVPESELPKGKKGSWGRVYNAFGRYRWFDLNDMDNRRRASIRREAGNYPIQSFAREVFFSSIVRLQQRIEKEGFNKEINGLPKMLLNLFIHDECVMQVHKSINPIKVYQMILEECLLQFEGHPPYYMGIAVVNNWYEGKSDKYEAPVDMVQQLVADYNKNPQKYDSQSMMGKDACAWTYNLIKQYMDIRYAKEVKKYTKLLQDGSILVDMDKFLNGFTNYFLKPRLGIYCTTHREYDKSDPNDLMVAQYEEALVNAFKGREVFIIYKGEQYSIQRRWNEYALHSEPTPSENKVQDNKAPEDTLDVFWGTDLDNLGDLSDLDSIDGFESSDSSGTFDNDLFVSKESEEEAYNREVEYAKEATLLLSGDRSNFINPELAVVDASEDEEFVNERIKTRVYDWGGQGMIVDVSGMDKDAFMKVRDYILKHRDVVGKSLTFLRNGNAVPAGVYVDYMLKPASLNKFIESVMGQNKSMG